MSRWIERYRSGQRRQVWTEMTSLGADVRADADGLQDARVITRETMVRARHNVERVIEELHARGFEFEADPLVPPSSGTAAQLDALEAEIGLLPLALRAWFEEVGQVNLNGRHPAWSFEYPDPLVVEAPIDYIRSEYEQWSEARGTQSDRGALFEMPVAPDYLHKANVSGGCPTGSPSPTRAPTACFSGSPTRRPS